MKEIKINGDYKLWTVSQTQLGKILGLSQPRINQLIDEQIVERDENSKSGGVYLIQSLKNYYSNKSASEDDGTVNFWKERAKNEKAKRELNELKLRKERGEIYEAAMVDDVVTGSVLKFRNKLLGLPVKISPQLEGKSVAQISELLTNEIYEELMELSRELEQAEYHDNREDSGGDKAAVENEDKRVGE